MNCIYCHQSIKPLGLHELETWRHCPNCVQQHDVDVIYRYSDYHKSFVGIHLCFQHNSLYRVSISPQLPYVYLSSLQDINSKHIMLYCPHQMMRMRSIIHPHAPTDMVLLDLPITTLWSPHNIKNKIQTYLVFS
jgi:hypothetical protein